MLKRLSRTRVVGLLAGFAVVLLLANQIRSGMAQPGLASPMSSEPYRFVITGPTAGTIDPCGCAAGMLGGLSRRPGLLQALSSYPGTVVLDCGDLVAPPRLAVVPGRPLIQTIKLNLILRALASMPYSAYCLGEHDLVVAPFEDNLSLAKPFDQDIHGLAGVGQYLFDRPPILTNVVSEKYPDLWVPFREISDPMGRRVLITCVIEKASSDWVPVYEHRDAAQSLREAIAKHAESGPADFIVCVYHGPTMEGARQLAGSVDGLGLIVFADHERADDNTVPPRLENGALIVRPGDRGKSILQLTVSRDGGQSAMQSIASQNIDEGSFEDPALKGLTHEYRQRAAAHTPPLVEAYAGLLMPAKGDLYVGSQACKRCHEAEYAVWEKSKHAHAYETLVQKEDAHLDPSCVYCHTVGYGTKLGFGDRRLAKLQDRMGWQGERPKPEPLEGVGCEDCHGPGLRHSLRPTGTNRTPMIVHKDEYNSCGKCHDTENSPHFQFKEYWEKIKHGAQQ